MLLSDSAVTGVQDSLAQCLKTPYEIVICTPLYRYKKKKKTPFSEGFDSVHSPDNLFTRTDHTLLQPRHFTEQLEAHAFVRKNSGLVNYSIFCSTRSFKCPQIFPLRGEPSALYATGQRKRCRQTGSNVSRAGGRAGGTAGGAAVIMYLRILSVHYSVSLHHCYGDRGGRSLSS